MTGTSQTSMILLFYVAPIETYHIGQLSGQNDKQEEDKHGQEISLSIYLQPASEPVC